MQCPLFLLLILHLLLCTFVNAFFLTYVYTKTFNAYNLTRVIDIALKLLSVVSQRLNIYDEKFGPKMSGKPGLLLQMILSLFSFQELNALLWTVCMGDVQLLLECGVLMIKMYLLSQNCIIFCISSGICF